MNLHKLHFINTRVSSREFDTRALVSLTVHSVRTRVPRVQSWQRSTKCISKVAWCWQTYDTAVEVESLGGWMSVSGWPAARTRRSRPRPGARTPILSLRTPRTKGKGKGQHPWSNLNTGYYMYNNNGRTLYHGNPVRARARGCGFCSSLVEWTMWNVS